VRKKHYEVDGGNYEVKNIFSTAELFEKIFTVALSGGVFQNLLLRNLVCERLERANFKILLNRMIPANDCGISVGQAFFAIQ